MLRNKILGEKIKTLRLKNGHTLVHLARQLNIDDTYLSKIENGVRKPSRELLEEISTIYALNETQRYELVEVLAGYNNTNRYEIVNDHTNPTREEVTYMQENNKENPNIKHTNITPQIQVPNNLPILYTDSAFITASPYGLVFDYAQTLGPTNNINVVSRIGMSKEHAEAFLKVLTQKLTEIELMKNKSEVEKRN